MKQTSAISNGSYWINVCDVDHDPQSQKMGTRMVFQLHEKPEFEVALEQWVKGIREPEVKEQVRELVQALKENLEPMVKHHVSVSTSPSTLFGNLLIAVSCKQRGLDDQVQAGFGLNWSYLLNSFDPKLGISYEKNNEGLLSKHVGYLIDQRLLMLQQALRVSSQLKGINEELMELTKQMNSMWSISDQYKVQRQISQINEKVKGLKSNALQVAYVGGLLNNDVFDKKWLQSIEPEYKEGCSATKVAVEEIANKKQSKASVQKDKALSKQMNNALKDLFEVHPIEITNPVLQVFFVADKYRQKLAQAYGELIQSDAFKEASVGSVFDIQEGLSMQVMKQNASKTLASGLKSLLAMYQEGLQLTDFKAFVKNTNENELLYQWDTMRVQIGSAGSAGAVNPLSIKEGLDGLCKVAQAMIQQVYQKDGLLDQTWQEYKERARDMMEVSKSKTNENKYKVPSNLRSAIGELNKKMNQEVKPLIEAFFKHLGEPLQMRGMYQLDLELLEKKLAEYIHQIKVPDLPLMYVPGQLTVSTTPVEIEFPKGVLRHMKNYELMQKLMHLNIDGFDSLIKKQPVLSELKKQIESFAKRIKSPDTQRLLTEDFVHQGHQMLSEQMLSASAYVIYIKKGYLTNDGSENVLSEAKLFTSRQKAENALKKLNTGTLISLSLNALTVEKTVGFSEGAQHVQSMIEQSQLAKKILDHQNQEDKDQQSSQPSEDAKAKWRL